MVSPASGTTVDIDANLRAQLTLIKEIYKLYNEGPESTDRVDSMYEAANALAEYVEAMDNWLGRGGHLPHDWRPDDYHV